MKGPGPWLFFFVHDCCTAKGEEKRNTRWFNEGGYISGVSRCQGGASPSLKPSNAAYLPAYQRQVSLPDLEFFKMICNVFLHYIWSGHAKNDFFEPRSLRWASEIRINIRINIYCEFMWFFQAKGWTLGQWPKPRHVSVTRLSPHNGDTADRLSPAAPPSHNISYHKTCHLYSYGDIFCT